MNIQFLESMAYRNKLQMQAKNQENQIQARSGVRIRSGAEGASLIRSGVAPSGPQSLCPLSILTESKFANNAEGHGLSRPYKRCPPTAANAEPREG